MCKVSVVVPIYNAGRKLHKCIRSICDQTFIDFELILVNDGSSDNSLKICEQHQKKDKRIVILNKENQGSIATRNKGVEISKGEYIMFVDADDWIDKQTIELLYNELINNNVDITVCNMYKVLGSSTFIKKKVQSWYFDHDKIYNEEEVKKDLVTAYFHGHPFPSVVNAKLYKKALLVNAGGYLKRIHFLGDDLFFNLEILLKAKTVKMINKPLYYYRAGGFSSKFMPFLFDDMVNGYEIQKEVIEAYYQDSREKQYAGISIMLLNTFHTCLQNVFNSRLGESAIKQFIENYSSNVSVIECLHNEGARTFFQNDFLNAIKNKDVEYLFRVGQKMHKRNKPRKYLIQFISQLS